MPDATRRSPVEASAVCRLIRLAAAAVIWRYRASLMRLPGRRFLPFDGCSFPRALYYALIRDERAGFGELPAASR